MWFMKKYLRPHWPKLILVFVLGIIVSVIPVASVQLIKPVLDNVFVGKDVHTLKLVAIGVVLLFTISGISKYIHFTMQRGIGELALMHLRNDLYSHIIKLPVKYHSKYHSGVLMTRIVNDGQKIPQGMMLSFDFLREPITFIGFLLSAFYASWKLTAIILVVAPIVVFVIAKVGTTVKRYTHRNLTQYGILGTSLNETFGGIRIIKSFSIETLMKARFINVNRELYRVLFKTYRVEELSTPLVEFIGSLIMSVVIFIGGMWVIKGQVTPGEFMTVFVSLGLAQGPVKKINSSNLQLQAAIAAIERIRELLDLPVERTRHGVHLEGIKDSIKFKNISFKYPEEEGYAIKNIDLEVKKGEIVAIVGSSGSGKTTMVNLLTRMYDVEEGDIFIDGVNIKDFSLNSLRDNIAVVSQDTFLFNDTIRMNIMTGNRRASEDEVLSAASSAYADNFIKKLPNGLNEMLGEKGLRLSGGEKQRLTIARAIIKKAPILVLDEATSALDSESEVEVQKAITKLMEGKTTIVIAHRLSTIKNAGRIIVLDKGSIVEQGSHSELLSKDGAYKKFYQKQFEENA
jgi:subfamily B ATP-binding cassette protein MsbA